MNAPHRGRRAGLALLLAAALALTGCQNAPRDVSADFDDCLTRHGVVTQDVEATLGSDGTIETLSVVIVSEGDVAYEPALRLACTAEVEENS
ncbi:MAG TPA: hypothetical protein VLB67_03310 [Acidimicrobiia bacterium]|nr:hypothetical protein [Acidimicrobiia bacterium]